MPCCNLCFVFSTVRRLHKAAVWVWSVSSSLLCHDTRHDNWHFQSVLTSLGKLSGIWERGCTWGMWWKKHGWSIVWTAFQIPRVHDHNKSPSSHLGFSSYLYSSCMAAGKMRHDSWRHSLWWMKSRGIYLHHFTTTERIGPGLHNLNYLRTLGWHLEWFAHLR